MENKGNALGERRSLRKTGPGFRDRQHLVGIAQAEQDVLKARLAATDFDETLRILKCGLGDAGDSVRPFESAHNPALEDFAGGGSGTVRLFTECAADGEKIVAGDYDRRAFDPACQHSIGMITDVNDVRAFRQPARKLPPKKEELVEVSEPFRDEPTGKLQPPEKRSWLNDFSLDAGRG